MQCTNAASSSAHGLVSKECTLVLWRNCLSQSSFTDAEYRPALTRVHTNTHTQGICEHATCVGTPGEFRQHVSISQRVAPIKTLMLKSDSPSACIQSPFANPSHPHAHPHTHICTHTHTHTHTHRHTLIYIYAQTL